MRGTAAGLVLAAGLLVLPATARRRTRNDRGGTAGRGPCGPRDRRTQPAPDPPAPKPVTLTVGADFPTAYMFRGIFQEDKGFIMQPFVDVGIAAAPGVTINAAAGTAFTPVRAAATTRTAIAAPGTNRTSTHRRPSRPAR